jgi:uncharacterized protein YbaR (Trm112 family)
MPASSVSFDASVIDGLACPACHGSFTLAESCLVCQGCGRAFPIVDGIPVLIAERAKDPERRTSEA